MLRKRDLADDPVVQFRGWFSEWRASEPYNANAMIVATADADGWPSARAVLLKGIDSRGFVFHTNRRSAKGLDIESSGRAALCFLWHPIERQVRVVGTVEHLPDSESDAYFASRPRGARIGAWASPQSAVIADRAELDDLTAAAEARFPRDGGDGSGTGGQQDAADAARSPADADTGSGDGLSHPRVPRPPHWGGYLVRPIMVEFWQGRRDRLHDRLRYRRPTAESSSPTDQSAWTIERLAP